MNWLLASAKRGGGTVGFGGRRAGAVHHGMSPGFEADEDECENGHDDLPAFGAFLFRGEFAATPLGRGLIAEVPDPCQDGQVDDGAKGGDPEHGNADGVLMPAAGRSVDAGCGGEGGEADGDADAADGKDGGAKTLGQSDDEGSRAQGAPCSGIQVKPPCFWMTGRERLTQRIP